MFFLARNSSHTVPSSLKCYSREMPFKKKRESKNEKEKKRIGCKNIESGSEEMNQWLTPHYFAEDLSPVPSTQVRQLTVV